MGRNLHAVTINIKEFLYVRNQLTFITRSLFYQFSSPIWHRQIVAIHVWSSRMKDIDNTKQTIYCK